MFYSTQWCYSTSVSMSSELLMRTTSQLFCDMDAAWLENTRNRIFCASRTRVTCVHFAFGFLFFLRVMMIASPAWWLAADVSLLLKRMFFFGGWGDDGWNPIQEYQDGFVIGSDAAARFILPSLNSSICALSNQKEGLKTQFTSFKNPNNPTSHQIIL